MDEAERCHDLVYIAYGRVLARGTERSILDQAGLTVYLVQGEGAGALAEPLKQAPGVLSVAAFGNSVHVAGEDAQLMEQALAGLRGRSGLTIRPAEPSLEDVFISLIGKAKDNYAAPGREQRA